MQDGQTRTQLRIPGPAPIPERVRSAASRQMINHRSAEFRALLEEIEDGLRYVLGTRNDVLLFPSSGTGGLEAIVANTLSPGEEALFFTCGTFGNRWADIAEAYGARPIRIVVPFGSPVTSDLVADVLIQNPNVRAVFIVHNETSTGVTSDIASIAQVVKGSGRLICIDSVSGAGCLPLEVDADQLDVVVTASQKGWLSPPGLAMVAVSKEALARSEGAGLPRWYFDFVRQKTSQNRGQTPMTPPLSVMYALQEGLRMIREEGRTKVWERHRIVASRLRDGIQSLGLTLLAQESARSNTVTAVNNPTDSPEQLLNLTRAMKEEHGVEVAGGQGDLAGRIFRIGHLGWIEEADADIIVNALDRALSGLRQAEGLTAATA